MEEFIKEKLNIELKVIGCKLSGKKIVASLESEVVKKEVIRKKSKLKGLKGENIFIENDLS